MQNNPARFPLQIGDTACELTEVQDTTPLLTKDYIISLAAQDGKALSKANPILAVVCRRTGFQETTTLNQTKPSQAQRVKLTQLTLMDGDNNQIHARLATHLTDTGRNLGEGDIICLDMFSSLTYHVNDVSQLFPALFVQRFHTIGHHPLPAQESINDILQCNNLNVNWNNSENNDHPPQYYVYPRKQPKPKCTYENRLCRKFGVNFIARCICDEIPPSQQDLAVVAEDCYLITQPFETLSNKSKRLMLYWWYATNIYSLCGKGRRGKLPDCLEYEIKRLFLPEDNEEDFTQFKKGNARTNH